jgi:hypothetical protein
LAAPTEYEGIVPRVVEERAEMGFEGQELTAEHPETSGVFYQKALDETSWVMLAHLLVMGALFWMMALGTDPVADSEMPSHWSLMLTVGGPCYLVISMVCLEMAFLGLRKHDGIIPKQAFDRVRGTVDGVVVTALVYALTIALEFFMEQQPSAVGTWLLTPKPINQMALCFLPSVFMVGLWLFYRYQPVRT